MFHNQSHLLKQNPIQANYGVAVTDVGGEGRFAFFVAGFGFPNLALEWDGEGYRNVLPPLLSAPERQAIGVAAADVNQDGREEIYVLNTDTFAGAKRFGDHFFAYRDGAWHDLFTLPENRRVVNQVAGRSVASIDRFGRERYGFVVANYGGAMCLYEMLPDGTITDSAESAGIAAVTGGRSLVCLPLRQDQPQMDIFAANENSPNFLFRNEGDGTFREVAESLGLSDLHEHGRGIAVLDADGNGHFDLVVGNWEGANRLFLQSLTGGFLNAALPEMAEPCRVRNVLAADFDNDGYEEIFFNNIGEPNRLFAYGRQGAEREWSSVDIGDALEPMGLGTGAAVADLNADGRLELLIAHGESGLQPLSLYETVDNGNHWLRVFPLTSAGAPARGARVTLTTKRRVQRRVIDAGSGYLCQMEPVAHFGLGREAEVEEITIMWTDGAKETIFTPEVRQTLRIPHP